MSETEVKPIRTRFRIEGTEGRTADLVFTTDPCDIRVTQIKVDSEHFHEKSPGIPMKEYEWFVCFAIYNRELEEKSQYADVQYKVILDREILMKGKELYTYFNDTLYPIREVSKDYREGKRKIKFTLDVGDPPIGMG